MKRELQERTKLEADLFARDMRAFFARKNYDVDKIFHLSKKQRAYLSALIAQETAKADLKRMQQRLEWSELGLSNSDLLQPLQKTVTHLRTVEERFGRIAERRKSVFVHSGSQAVATENIAYKVVSMGDRLGWPERRSEKGSTMRRTLRTLAGNPTLLYDGTFPPSDSSKRNIFDLIGHVSGVVRTLPTKLRPMNTLAALTQRESKIG